MKALIYERPGNPSEVLKVVTVATPILGPKQVLLKMKIMPINPMDLATIRGVYRTPQKTPTIPGYEGLGEVVQVGGQVEILEVGMFVLMIPIKSPGWTNGVWQEFVCVDEAETLPIPQSVNPLETPQFFNTILTAWVLVKRELKLRNNQTLLLTAAGSGVGRLILGLSKLIGFSVIAVVRRADQVEEIKALGAKAVICSATEDISQRTMSITNLKGVDAVIDAVGGEVSAQCFRTLAERGTMIVFGLLDLERNSSFDVRKMLFYNLTVKGFWLPGWWTNNNLPSRIQAVNEAFEMIRTGHMAPKIEKAFSLSEFKLALAESEKAGRTGRIVFSN